MSNKYKSLQMLIAAAKILGSIGFLAGAILVVISAYHWSCGGFPVRETSFLEGIVLGLGSFLLFLLAAQTSILIDLAQSVGERGES